jgi:hypothetical protein
LCEAIKPTRIRNTRLIVEELGGVHVGEAQLFGDLSEGLATGLLGLQQLED